MASISLQGSLGENSRKAGVRGCDVQGYTRGDCTAGFEDGSCCPGPEMWAAFLKAREDKKMDCPLVLPKGTQS